MLEAPIPDDDEERLRVLRALEILDTLPEQVYDDLASLAAHIAGTPIALVSLVDADRQWFKARVGLDAEQTGRDVSFCGHAVVERQTFVVPDAHADARFADNPLVTGAPHVRFYAGAPIITPEGAALGTLCVIDHEARELDEGQQAQLEALARQVAAILELRKSELDKQAALDALHVQQAFWDLSLEMLCVLDADGRFEQANPAFDEILGQTSDQLMGRELASLAPDSEVPRVRSWLELMQPDGTAAFLETRWMSARGEPRWLRWSGRRTAAGRVVAVAHDVTSDIVSARMLREARDRADHANKLKSAFLANMSHELRTPLNSVIGFANLLARKATDLPPKHRVFVERIRANGQHLLDVINDVLDLSRVEAGRMKVAPERVDVAALVQEVVESLEGRRATTGLFLQVEGCEQGAVAFADPLRLRQILTNLVGNALKFTTEGGVVVRLQASDGMARAVQVVDTGVGIPEAAIEQLFQPFYQVDSGYERRFEGTGLGLSIAHRLCQLMGFDLRAASAEGLGSTFEVCFEPEDAPELRHVGVDVAAGPSAEARSVVASEAPPAAAMATVLVVDDDADARWLLEQQLEELGYRVVVADSGARALQLAHAVKPDLITLDLHMPEASGWDFLRTLRDDDDLRDVPVVICSVVAGRVVGHPCGTVAVLPKPVDRERLGDTLHGALDPGRSRVLVVDDDRDVLDIATDALRQRGLHVRTATTGARALEQLRHDPLPDALVLDLGLPDLSGSEVLGRIRSDPRTEALPVVVFTALGHDEVDPSVHDRALDVVPKHGLDFTAVARAVTDVLGNRSGP